MAALAALLLAALPSGEASAQTLHLDEQKVKAGLVYNFLKYTEWDKAALASRNQIEVCVFGESALNDYLLPMQGRTAQQYAIRIVNKSLGDDVSTCSVAFIHRSQAENLPELLRLFEGTDTLTVSDIGYFVQRGGMVELSTRQDRRVHLYINQPAVAAANLNIQNRLLSLSEGHDAR
jgi:hypothetical protein